ncbi:hypothetical protein [Paenibacillus sp. FSL E2-0201]|uniref:hypothetical protein n=1 Tax=unclassified Paenibacillus TaxID=185978 RepID=UPI0030D9C150
MQVSIVTKRCENDADYAKASLFILNNRRDLHPGFTTVDMIALIYSYLSEGQILNIMDINGQVIAIAAYYQGTPDLHFEDKHVAYVDNVILDRAHRNTRVFIRGFNGLIEQIIQDHPETEEFRFAALNDNAYLQKLYSKFAKLSYTREGELGKENIYSTEISSIRALLAQFGRVY